MEQKYCVYIHQNIINSKVYIGITKQIPSVRWGKDGINYKSCPRFYSAIKHYGWDMFEHKILYTNLNHDDACIKERELIKLYDSQNAEYGYNILEGGAAPIIPFDVRLRMSNSMRGNKNGLGHPCSDEKKRKISESQKGRSFTQEHKRRISEAKTGKPTIPCSDEKKRKISESHKKKPILCIDTMHIYPSIQQCARELNIDATAICAVCKGRHKSCKGLHFCYID